MAHPRGQDALVGRWCPEPLRLVRWPVPWASFVFGEAQVDTGHGASFAGKQRPCGHDPREREGVPGPRSPIGAHVALWVPTPEGGSYQRTPLMGACVSLNALNTWPSVPKLCPLYPGFPLRENIPASSTLPSLFPKTSPAPMGLSLRSCLSLNHTVRLGRLLLPPRIPLIELTEPLKGHCIPADSLGQGPARPLPRTLLLCALLMATFSWQVLERPRFH